MGYLLRNPENRKDRRVSAVAANDPAWITLEVLPRAPAGSTVFDQMSKSINASPKVPSDEVLRQLADLLLVPPEQREFFFESICTNVQTAWELDGLAKQGLASKRGKKLVDAALALYDTLGNLNNPERALIEGIFSKAGFIFDRISSEGVVGLNKTAYQLALLASFLTGKPTPRLPSQLPETPGRGRRSGAVKHPIFQQFVWQLLISIKGAGGSFTFAKETLGGTLVTAINMLARCLPHGFVPGPLPGSTMQNS